MNKDCTKEISGINLIIAWFRGIGPQQWNIDGRFGSKHDRCRVSSVHLIP